MKKNVHPVERVARIVVGLFLLSLVFWGSSSYWFLLGGILLVTGLSGWCLPYALLGINTCEIKNKKV